MIFVVVVYFVQNKGTAIQFLDHSHGDTIDPCTDIVVVVVNHCSTSLFGTNGLLSDIVN